LDFEFEFWWWVAGGAVVKLVDENEELFLPGFFEGKLGKSNEELEESPQVSLPSSKELTAGKFSNGFELVSFEFILDLPEAWLEE
jgi:hypothetical protein